MRETVQVQLHSAAKPRPSPLNLCIEQAISGMTPSREGGGSAPPSLQNIAAGPANQARVRPHSNKRNLDSRMDASKDVSLVQLGKGEGNA